MKRLYLLIRPKRGVNTAARLEQLLASRLFDRYVCIVGLTKGDTSLGRWVARLVALGSSLGSNQDISQKYKMGDISTGAANRRKKI